MSVMSAAEASQAAGASPEIPLQPLRIARSAASQDDAGAAGAGWARRRDARGARRYRAQRERAAGHARSGWCARSGLARCEPRSPAGIVPQPRATAREGQRRRGPGWRRGQGWRRSGPGGHAAGGVRPVQAGRGQADPGGQPGPGDDARPGDQAGRVAQRPGAVRLTRRGRRVVAGFVIGVVIVAVTRALDERCRKRAGVQPWLGAGVALPRHDPGRGQARADPVVDRRGRRAFGEPVDRGTADHQRERPEQR